ncbi:dihydroorotase [Chloroflexota bacterium]
MDLLIQNGRIIDPSNNVDRQGDVLVIDGKISKIDENISAPDHNCALFDASGLIVSPGFIDLHCHLRQPGFVEKETIASGTKAAAKGGFTTICCMPNTTPPIDTLDTMKQVYAIAQNEGIIRVFPIAAITKGRAGKSLVHLAELKTAGAVAFSDDGSPVWDEKVMRQALEQSRALNVPIIDHCEDLDLSMDGVMNTGSIADKLGYKGIPAIAEERMVSRDIELARQTNGRLHIAHVSTAGSVDLIRTAKEQGINITAEVTPHHLTLTEEEVLRCGTNAKVNPPLRTKLDIDALIKGLREGVIDAIATDHAPHTEADKSVSFEQAAFGISGFETVLGSLMTLVHQGKIDLPTLISKLTYEPARIIGRPGVNGGLGTTLTADITIFNPDIEWAVDPSEFFSKGKNTPLTGTILKGIVATTIVNGEIVYQGNF